VHASVGLVRDPGDGSSFVARTQEVPTVGSIGATEDAATGGETPPGACLNLRTGALTQPEDGVAVGLGRERLERRVAGDVEERRHNGAGHPQVLA
jgi:hypothetical protein